MRKYAYGLIMAALILPFGATFADEELRAECQKEAVEAQIPAEEMDEFMKDCMGETEDAPMMDSEQPQEESAPSSNE